MLSEELAPGIWRIPTLTSALNAFLVAGAGGLTLIDPGLSWTTRRLQRGIEHAGHAPADVRRVVTTHAHLDHAGALAAFKRISGATVYAHAEDATFIARGDSPPGDRGFAPARLLADAPGSGYPACIVDEMLADGDELDGLRVLHTPGHTPGHISLLHAETGVLLTGDAVINLGWVRRPIPWFCSSLADVRASARRLAALEFGVAAFAHGAPVADRARERIATVASR